jgi:hypothetical protein
MFCSSFLLCSIIFTFRTVHLCITYSMLQSPSWEANWFATSQEIPRISRNPKVHYRTHKRPPPVPILGQPNPVHIPTSHLLEIHPNIIHPSTPRSPQWSLSLRLRAPLLKSKRKRQFGKTPWSRYFILVNGYSLPQYFQLIIHWPWYRSTKVRSFRSVIQ